MIAVPTCFKRDCLYFIGVIQPDGTELTETVTCLAFPKGIPDEIAYGNDLHKEIRPDQVGSYTFKPTNQQ